MAARQPFHQNIPVLGIALTMGVQLICAIKGSDGGQLIGVGADINRFCASFSTWATRSSGRIIQPIRQPVIEKYFDILFTIIAFCVIQGGIGTFAIDQPMINFIRNQAHPMLVTPAADFCQLAIFQHGPSRIGRAGDHQTIWQFLPIFHFLPALAASPCSGPAASGTACNPSPCIKLR